MKILLTGGATGGHFYPLIAIAEAVNTVAKEEKLLQPELFFMSTTPYDKSALFENNITFRRVFAGKARIYFSLLNIIDMFKLALGLVKGLWSVFLMYPDVVVSKGGYASVPAVFAARLLRIPIIVHESDSVPGRANQWAGKFAMHIAVSWPEAAAHFPEGRTVVTGQPVRSSMLTPISRGAHEYLNLSPDVPILLILGGSQGAKRVNDTVMEVLPNLLEKYQVIHQTGDAHLESVQETASVVLSEEVRAKRYRPFATLNDLALRMASGASSLIVSRAGSTIFEIAAWGKPSIIVPITESNGDHQRRNAFNYQSSGACVVIEEKNLTSSVLHSEIVQLMDDEERRKQLGEAARSFFREGASEKIAKAAIDIGLSHEKE